MILPFHQLEFDATGRAASPGQLGDLIAACRNVSATDLIFLAHGFRCDAADATALFTNLVTSLSPNLPSLSTRAFAIAGVYWPSEKYPESFNVTALPDNRKAQDQFVAKVLAPFGDGREDPAEGLPLLHQMRGSDLLHALRTHRAKQEGGIENVERSVEGGIDTFLNFVSWYAMKKLSGDVGATGVAESVQTAREALGNIRIHLVGHSLGGRLVTACCKALGEQRAAPISSLSLLEAAFSHFGFSPDAVSGQPGFFRPVIESGIIRGPMISTFSKQDTVVGAAYAVASRLAHDSLQAIGDAADRYGGIGHNGAQRTPESSAEALHQVGQIYEFKPGIVTCVDGSGGLIASHGDVTNPNVAYAIASAINAAA